MQYFAYAGFICLSPSYRSGGPDRSVWQWYGCIHNHVISSPWSTVTCSVVSIAFGNFWSARVFAEYPDDHMDQLLLPRGRQKWSQCHMQDSTLCPGWFHQLIKNHSSEQIENVYFQSTALESEELIFQGLRKRNVSRGQLLKTERKKTVVERNHRSLSSWNQFKN